MKEKRRRQTSLEIAKRDVDYIDIFFEIYPIFKLHDLTHFGANVKNKAWVYLTDKAIVQGQSE